MSSNQSHFSDESSSHFKMLAFNRKNNLKSTAAQKDLKGKFPDLTNANQTMSTFNKSNTLAQKNKSATKVMKSNDFRG